MASVTVDFGPSQTADDPTARSPRSGSVFDALGDIAYSRTRVELASDGRYCEAADALVGGLGVAVEPKLGQAHVDEVARSATLTMALLDLSLVTSALRGIA